MSIRTVLLATFAALVFALGLFVGHANAVPVRFDYLFGTVELSLISVLMIAFAFGVLLSLLVAMLRMLGMRGELRRLRRQLRDTEAELRNLRSLPLQTSR